MCGLSLSLGKSRPNVDAEPLCNLGVLCYAECSYRSEAMNLTVTHTLYTDDGEEMVVFPAHYEVCERCRGTGSHVNPSIDGNGLGAEDFEDEEFAEAYFNGAYDVACYECRGLRVVPVMNEDLSPELAAKLVLLESQWEDDAADARLSAMERSMGA